MTTEKRLVEAEVSDVKQIKTFGDLERLIKDIELKRKTGKLVNKAKDYAISQIVGLVPGGGNVKSAYDI